MYGLVVVAFVKIVLILDWTWASIISRLVKTLIAVGSEPCTHKLSNPSL